jgi:hypothetical protein
MVEVRQNIGGEDVGGGSQTEGESLAPGELRGRWQFGISGISTDTRSSSTWGFTREAPLKPIGREPLADGKRRREHYGTALVATYMCTGMV